MEPPPPSRADFDVLLALVEKQAAELAELRSVLEEQAAKLADLRARNAVLEEQLNERERELAELKRRAIGRTTERSTGSAKRSDKPTRPKNDARAQKKRRKNREKRRELPEEVVRHAIDSADGRCPCCDADALVALSAECSVEYEWVPGRLVRRLHERQRAVCEVCKAFASGPAPARVVDGGLYGPGFIARLVVHKQLDCVPLYRQAAIFNREGLQVARSTLVDLFHRAASLLEPLYERMLERVRASRVVYADETSLKMQRRKKLGFVWTFAGHDCITYVFSPNRSGETPERVLGDSTGVLVVDGYSGYNHVTVPERRVRAGCNAHARRKFTDIDDDDAHHIIELYKEVFAVERDAAEKGIAGTPEHLALRTARAGPAMTAIKARCDELEGKHGPKTPMGKALGYLRNQWKHLTRFLEDIDIEPSNNLSERLLRIIALGRKNYLFVGHEGAGRRAAMITSLAQTCVLHDVDPQAYLADILIRVQDHPHAALDDLLPHRWKTLFAPDTDPAS